MAKPTKFKCPYCGKIYALKQALYTHMKKDHGDQLQDMSPAQAYFNFRYKKTGGKCIICGRATQFNEVTEKYDRIDREVCRQKYREMFRQRMIQKYGKDSLLQDPDQQKKMLANRKISGTYTWSDGIKFSYVGKYELEALEYLDKTLGLKSTDIISPAPITIPYEFEGVQHFYIPDIFIIPFNLLVEVKGSNNHYQARDKDKEAAKDKAALKSEYNYVKVLDKNYDGLQSMIETIKNFGLSI